MNNAPDVRVSIFSHDGTLLKLDASADFAKFDSKYENTPTGCGAAELKLALLYEDVAARGYYSARNIVQINTGDDTLKTAITSGATKLYINATSLAAYNNTWEPDTPEIYLYDGATLTMRIPVTGTGNDAGGNFLNVGTPIAGGGNPATIPAYAPGTTIGRRRYAGQIIKRNRPNSRLPEATISCGALTARLKEALGTFTITNAANVDIGAAIFAGINQFVARWPEFVISAGNFPTVGNIASGTWTDAPVETFIRDCINQVTTGDSWSLYIGHDRVVRLIKLYTSSGNTYTYNVTLPQEVQSFEPLQFQNDDQDASALFNSFKVIGDVDPTTKQPVSGIYQDATSISNYGQIDAAAVTNVGIKTQAQANALAQGISNQFSVAKSNARFRVFCDEPGVGPLGITQGDVVSGVSNVTVSGFNATGSGPNLIPDSPLAFTSGSSALWTLVGLGPMANNGPGGVAAFNSTVGSGAAIGFEAGESVAVPVTPGQSYMLSGYIGASAVSGTALPSWSIYDTNISVEYARAAAVAGSAGRFQLATPWVCPAGVTQVRIVCDTNNALVASGQKITFSQPQFESGSTASAYSPNAADVSIYGLCVSAVTTLVPGGTRYQDVQYSAVEPDWNAAMQERTNALAAALMKNKTTPQAIDQYCVSIDAFPAAGIPTSGLAVNPPTFLALFAPNTAVKTISSPSFTCLANQTNWAWISSNGTWTVNQTDATVTGAILFGIFMTNGMTVIGQWPKAPVGVMRIGVGNINVAGNLPAPTTSGTPTAANAAAPTSLAADVAINCTVTNVPQDGSVYGVTYYFRTHGQTAWIPYDEQNLAGLPNPAATQTLPAMVLGQLQNGTTYDFGIGYVGLAGYGPVTQIVASFVANAIVVTTPYIIGTTSPTPTVTLVTTTPTTSANGLACAMRLQFTLTNQPTDGSLSRISTWFRRNGDTSWTFYDSRGVPGLPNPSASQAYDITLADLTNGQNYDFGVTYENAQGQDSATVGVIASNISAAVINLPGTVLSGIPAGMTFSSSGSVTSYSAPNAGACSAVLSLTLAITANGGTVANWLSSIQVLTAPTGTTNWTVNTEIPTSSLGTFAPTVSLGAGQAYDIAVRLISNNPSSVSGIQSAGVTTVAQTIGSSSLQKMPGALKTNGPTFSGTSVPTLARVDTSGSQATFTLGFTVTDFGTPQPPWFQCATVYFRLGGRTFSNDGRQLAPTQLTFGSGVTSPTNLIEFSLPIGQTVEFGLSVTDLSGDESKIVWPSQWGGTAGSDPAGALIDTGDGNRGIKHGRGPVAYRVNINADASTNASTPNLFPNSDFAIGGGTTGIGGTFGGTVPKFWGVYAGDTVTFSQDAAASPPVGLYAWKLLNSGAGAWTAGLGHGLVCGSGVTDGLQPFVLRAGTKYTVSFYAKTNEPTGATFLLNNNAGITVTAKSGFPTTVAQNVWQRFAFDVVVGSADYSGGLYPYCPTAVSPGNSVWFAAPQNEEGTVLSVWSGPSYASGVTDLALPHANKNLGAIDPNHFDSSNNFKSSGQFDTTIANLTDYTNDFIFHTSTAATPAPDGTTTTTTTMSYWIDNGTASTNITFKLPDGTTKVASYSGTSGSPMGTVTGIHSITNPSPPPTYVWKPVAFLVYYDFVNTTWHVTPYIDGALPPLSDVNVAYADGKFACIAVVGGSSQVTPVSGSSTTISAKGGSGGRALN